MSTSSTDEVSLWRNRDFNVFWFGQTLSALGDAFATVAIPLLVLQATGSLQSMGRLTSIVSVAHVVSGLVSGTIVDRVDRRRLMIACDIGRWVVYSAIPLVWWLSGPSYALLVLAGSVGAMLGNTFQVAYITAIANLVPRHQLIGANGRLHGSYAAMFFVGPMLAGYVCHRFGAATAVAIDCGSYIASAASLTLVRARFSGTRKSDSVGAIAGFVEGVRFLWSTPALRAVTVLLGTASLLGAGRENLLVYQIKRVMHQDDRAVGQVFAVGAMGALLGSVMASRLRARWGFAACWLGAGVLLGAATTGLGAVRTIPAMAGFAMGIAAAESVRGINTMTLRQEITPDHMLGRVTASFWALLTVPAALGASITAGVAERVGVRPVLMTLGGLLIALMAVGLATPLRRPVTPARA